jgi:hypothetical protein
MKLSTQPTEYILLKARTNSEWDTCDFALIQTSEEWKKDLQKRLNSIEPLTEDPMFISMSYYDTGVEFYKDDDTIMPHSAELLKDKEWAFITTNEEEIETLSPPENSLDCHELVVNSYGTAYYKAYGKHTGEEFWTAHFSIQKIIEHLNRKNNEEQKTKNPSPKINNIGIIKCRKYEERLILNEHFIIDNLFNIILSDSDYIKFQIVDQSGNLLLSTHYPETGKTVEYLKVVQVKREEEILGTTYNACKTPSLVHNTKVTWTVSGGIYKTKKEAQKYVDRINGKAKLLIEKYVHRNSCENSANH